MNQENLATFKERLEKLKNEILLLIQDEEDSTVTREALDDIDQTSNMLAREMGSKLSKNHKTNLMKVEQALRRIKEKSYGKCMECSADIPAARLQVLPFAELCVRCQEEQEKYA
jgi:RNA polymerase-binding protein DksA